MHCPTSSNYEVLLNKCIGCFCCLLETGGSREAVRWNCSNKPQSIARNPGFRAGFDA